MMSAFNLKLPVAIGSDHAGFQFKEFLKSFLESENIPFKDLGTHSPDSVDYPDFAHPVSDAVENGAASFGILICGSGNGVAMSANKHAGIRAALCWQEEIAKLARKHNDANVICLPARFISMDEGKELVRAFMLTEFEGGRHERRVNKIPL
ncbi:MAG: ribose 5-phosphate isomerase B [Chitinophagaceae bacterium]|nr:ribose 5-phosphate isomerase B [Chitinophagaceae bacterium]